MTINEFIKYIERHASKLPKGLETELRYVEAENDCCWAGISINRINVEANPFNFIPREGAQNNNLWDSSAVEFYLIED